MMLQLFTCVVFIGLVLKVLGCHDVQQGIVTYYVKAMPCTSEYLDYREPLGPAKGGLDSIPCVIFCSNDRNCGLSLVQQFQNGSVTCRKISGYATDVKNSPDSITDPSATCKLRVVNPCLNGGTFQFGVCRCKRQFTGDVCQHLNEDFCNSNWTKILTSYGYGTFDLDEPDILQAMAMHRSKIRFRDESLGITSVACHGRESYRNSKYEQHTQTLMEKTAWNRMADYGARMFKYFVDSGVTDTLQVECARYAYSSVQGRSSHEFVALRESPFQVTFTSGSNMWSVMKEHLENGYEFFGNNFMIVQNAPNVIAQQTFIRQGFRSGETMFQDPPLWWNVKSVMGGSVYNLLIEIGAATNQPVGSSPSGISASDYFNPCWMKVDTDGSGSLSGTSISLLRGYLRVGHDVRVQADNAFHNVLEVIDHGEVLTFLVAPYMSKTGTESLDPYTTYGVKRLVTTSGTVESCEHEMEGETVIDLELITGANVRWFVDRKTWECVYSVFSDSSMGYGSLSELAEGVRAGKDVRVWLKWLHVDKSRFLDTHMNSVTDDGKVSSESVLTWQVEDPGSGNIRLSSRCDYEYVLVTSDGYVEVMQFNIWTPGRPVPVTDVMITWFLN